MKAWSTLIGNWGLIAILCIYPISLLSQRTLPFYLALAAAFGMWLLFTVIRGRVSIISFKVAWPFYLLATLFFLSAAWSIAPERTLVQAFGFGAFVWLFYLLHTQLVKGNSQLLTNLSVVVTFLTCFLVYTVYLKYGAVRIAGTEMAEEIGTFSNKAGATLVVALPILLYRFHSAGKFRVFFLVIIGINLIAIFFTASRGAYAMAAVGAVTYYALSARRSIEGINRLALVLIGAAFAGQLLLSFLSQTEFGARTVERFANSSLISDSGQQDMERKIMFATAGKAFMSNPFLGVGYEGFYEYMERHAGFGLISHSLLVTAVAETGVIGLSAMLALLVVATRNSARHWMISKKGSIEDRAYGTAVLVAFGVAIVHGMFRPQWDNVMFYAALAAAFGPLRITHVPRKPSRTDVTGVVREWNGNGR